MQEYSFNEGDIVQVARIDHLTFQGRDPHPEDGLIGAYGRVVALVEEPECEAGTLARVRFGSMTPGIGADLVLAAWEVEFVR